MYPKVASAYDQNPARIRLVVDANRKRNRPTVPVLPTGFVLMLVLLVTMI